ncbi:hypothetical protein [Rubrivirga sp.]|uniref:hypothetical protein n=1 Tax=Rubrivirga sp. TaxID=1885344 RepID=UPI003B52C214
MALQDSFEHLETWLAEHAPVLLENLNPPASDADIEAAEAELGVTFPASVRSPRRCARRTGSTTGSATTGS